MTTNQVRQWRSEDPLRRTQVDHIDPAINAGDLGVGTLASSVEGMTAGNILVGGVIGLGVDAASGAINKYEPGVEIKMTPIKGCRSAPAA